MSKENLFDWGHIVFLSFAIAVLAWWILKTIDTKEKGPVRPDLTRFSYTLFQSAMILSFASGGAGAYLRWNRGELAEYGFWAGAFVCSLVFQLTDRARRRRAAAEEHSFAAAKAMAEQGFGDTPPTS